MSAAVSTLIVNVLYYSRKWVPTNSFIREIDVRRGVEGRKQVVSWVVDSI